MRFTFRNIIFGALYLTALGVWVALVTDTLALAGQAMTPLPLPPTAAPPTATALPTLTPLPEPTPEAVPEVLTAPLRQEPQAAAPTIHPKTGRYISAWLINAWNAQNRQSFIDNADILDEISPFWYITDTNGNLYHERIDTELLDLARSKNVLVIPTIHNVVKGEDPVPAMLSNPAARRRHVQQIVSEVLNRNYDGFDIDYEFLGSGLREEYTAFITDLGAALRAEGKLLTIAVHAKTSDYGGLGGYQDWVALGQAVDRLRIMTYDYHWRGGGPGPVAPVYWVQEVAEYARSVVDPAKVVIGVPFYGYNWPNGGTAIAQLWVDINDRIKSQGLSVNLMESNARGLVQENWITYGGGDGQHTVWFSTKSGLDAKLRLVQSYDLAGVAIWALGGEDPASWEGVRRRLVEDPFESQRMINQVLPEH